MISSAFPSSYASVSLVRVADQEDQPALFVFENAQSFLEYNWGKNLNRYLLDSIRIHPDLAELNPDLEAPTYAEVLKRVSELDLRPWQPGEIPSGSPGRPAGSYSGRWLRHGS